MASSTGGARSGPWSRSSVSSAVLRWAVEHQRDVISRIREFVECESPSFDAASLRRFAGLVASQFAGFARVRFQDHLIAEVALPGRKKSGQVLVLGHLDTVWPIGTLRHMPFREKDGRLWGPGVLDMKSGIAFFLAAVMALRELDIPVARRVVLQLNSDEEVGSHSSRALTERNAARSECVLVLEPGTGLAGKLKTARKGVGDYRVTVRGKAAHSGVDFAAGASAVVELARQIQRIAGFTQMERGITVNPGVISGGSRSNVIAAEAMAHVDVRIPRLRDAQTLDRKFQSLKPLDKRCTIEVTGGINRPPMERTHDNVKLFRLAQQLGREIGIEVEESSTGGGSDGNFTSALGIPTLDGLGGVGEGAHAIHESILIDRIADRIAVLAGLL
jgi:glutamate carboxypeptidase